MRFLVLLVIFFGGFMVGYILGRIRGMKKALEDQRRRGEPIDTKYTDLK